MLNVVSFRDDYIWENRLQKLGASLLFMLVQKLMFVHLKLARMAIGVICYIIWGSYCKCTYMQVMYIISGVPIHNIHNSKYIIIGVRIHNIRDSKYMAEVV